jgi:hypothetical protein
VLLLTVGIALLFVCFNERYKPINTNYGNDSLLLKHSLPENLDITVGDETSRPNPELDSAS